jgi:hypothetical protein
MSAPIPPLPGSSEVLFRVITPVFGHRIEGTDRFMHSGRSGTERFEITLLPYQAFCAEVFPSYDQEMVACLQEHRAQFWEGFPVGASHFLLTDVIYPGVMDLNDPAKAPSYGRIQAAVMDALRLRSSAGIVWHLTFVFTRPRTIYGSRMVTLYPSTRQRLLGRHLGPESVLLAADFAACQRTITTLLGKTWSDTVTFDKVLGLALEYHRLSFTLEQVAHAFLILMVAFEALFKKDDNVSKAAKWIGRAVSGTKKGCKDIQKAFNTDPVSFRTIRNQIAHGDTSLNVATVRANYPDLYRYLTAAIRNRSRV